MDERDRQFLIEQLNATESELMAALEGLSETEPPFRPAPGAWSIHECLEHLVAVEKRSLRAITTRAVSQGQPLLRREQSARLLEAGSRKNKLEAPEAVQPSGRYASTEEAKAAFLAARDQMREHVAHTPDDLDSHVLEHPLLGKITCYEWVLFVAGHTRRHLDQIREIRDLERSGAIAAAGAVR
jgi:uncharacterized damage-inducible protein DinB